MPSEAAQILVKRIVALDDQHQACWQEALLGMRSLESVALVTGHLLARMAAIKLEIAEKDFPLAVDIESKYPTLQKDFMEKFGR